MRFSQKQAWVWWVVLAIIILVLFWLVLHEKKAPTRVHHIVKTRTLHVSSNVSGLVAKIYVKPREHVKKHQHILLINRKPWQASLQKAKKHLTETMVHIHALQKQLTQAQAYLQLNQQQLHKVQQEYLQSFREAEKDGVNKPKMLAEAKVLQSAKLTVQTAKQKVYSLKEQLGPSIQGVNEQIANAKERLSRLLNEVDHIEVNAPDNGVIKQLFVKPGKRVKAGQALFVLQLQQTQK